MYLIAVCLAVKETVCHGWPSGMGKSSKLAMDQSSWASGGRWKIILYWFRVLKTIWTVQESKLHRTQLLPWLCEYGWAHSTLDARILPRAGGLAGHILANWSRIQRKEEPSGLGKGHKPPKIMDLLTVLDELPKLWPGVVNHVRHQRVCLEVFDWTSHAEVSFLFCFRPEEFPEDYMSKAWLLASRAVQRQ